jgi:G:T-mismatch repair DNA endonuclease (very short patch repair protein)
MSKLWSDEEVETLKENYQILPINEISALLNRTEYSIYIKANKLNLSKGCEWTNKELEILRRVYSTKPWEYILSKINRDKEAICIKANRLGLHKNDVMWTDENLSSLLFLFYEGLYYKEIAEILDRTDLSVGDKCRNIKLKRPHSYRTHGLTNKHKQHLKESRIKMMKDDSIILQKMNEGAREYHRTHENTCLIAGWNKGMKPWEWMKVSKDKFFSSIVSNSNNPTSIEQRVIDICKKYNLPYKYTGDFKFWIDGKNPDFVNCNGEKKLIELFGNYWHKEEDIKTKSDHYGKYGFKTLVIWESDMKQMSDEDLCNRIVNF